MFNLVIKRVTIRLKRLKFINIYNELKYASYYENKKQRHYKKYHAFLFTKFNIYLTALLKIKFA
jgi:hypothetical protein